MSKVRKKSMWCRGCKRNTLHTYAGKKTPYEGSFLMRVLAVVLTMGMSETAWAERFWQCDTCGNVEVTE